MSIVAVSRVIPSPPSHVWSLVKDMGAIYRFNPYVESSPLIGEQSSGLDAQRTCHFYDGGHAVERVSEYEESRKLGIEVLESSMPLRRAKASFELKPTNSGGTKVTMSMDYEVKYGPIGWLMNAMMMRRMMTKMLARVLAGLDEHARTGSLIGKDGKPLISQLAAA